jgi:hypothetical protein
MKNLKITLSTLAVLFSTSLMSMEAPPAAPGKIISSSRENYFSQLPAELRGEVLQYAFMGSGYPDVKALANVLTAMQNKVTVDALLKIFNSLNTTYALALAEQLQHLPLMQDPQLVAWVETEKNQFINGQALFNAAAKGSVEPVKNLLANRYIHANWRNPAERSQAYSLTPLLRVVSLALPQETVAEIVDLLLKAGANANLASKTKTRDGNKDDWTPLIAAAGKGNAHVVRMLLSAKANVDAQDIYGDTALIEAAKKGHREIIELLLNAGANPSLANNKGETAYDVTITPEIKQLLEAARVKRK